MNSYRNFWNTVKYGSVFFLGIILDQWTKYWAVSHLSFWKSLSIFPPVLQFQLVYNHGAAYGILQNQRLLLVTVSISVVVVSALFYRRIATTPLSKWGLTFLLIGTIGNSIDRLFLGYVVDFIDIKLVPVFNIADMMINAGVICFILDMFVVKNKNET